MRKHNQNWKNVLQRIVGVIVIAVLVTETTACGKNQREYEEQVLGMLKEKYEEDFDIQEYLGREPLEGYYTARCYPKKAPQVLFEVRTAEDGSSMEDGYVSARVCKKAEQQIDKNLEQLEGYLLEKIMPVSRSVDSNHADMDMKEFMELKTKNRFAVYLMYCPQEKNADKAYEQIMKAFQGLECMSGSIQLYVMQENELKKMQEYLSVIVDLDYRFEQMTEGKERISIPFDHGIIGMPEEEFTKKVGGLL